MSKYLTKQKALDTEIELWTWLSQPKNASKDVTDWRGWKKYPALDYCPLCNYAAQYKLDACDRHCPYYQCYDVPCYDKAASFRLWCLNGAKKDFVQAHHYAQQFLAELKAIAASGKVRGIKKDNNG